ncbi:MAG TPA: hypothetical protein VFP65_20530 [Anaeromyxobacteraceae bacterium]|nr:hypothetical protein [Anaeromyxobacteraceae bacterium]
MHRETMFHCTYASGRARRSAVIAAWDAEAAESIFRQSLAEEPEGEPGGIIEVEARGRLRRRSEFRTDQG